MSKQTPAQRATELIAKATEYGKRMDSLHGRIGYLEGIIQGLCDEVDPHNGEPLSRKLQRLIEEAKEAADELADVPNVSEHASECCDYLSDALSVAKAVYIDEPEPDYGEGSGGDLMRAEARAINAEWNRQRERS
jgi:hypothetical protein